MSNRTKWKCGACLEVFPTEREAEEHSKRCEKRPENKWCRTCKHLYKFETVQGVIEWLVVCRWLGVSSNTNTCPSWTWNGITPTEGVIMIEEYRCDWCGENVRDIDALRAHLEICPSIPKNKGCGSCFYPLTLDERCMVKKAILADPGLTHYAPKDWVDGTVLKRESGTIHCPLWKLRNIK